MIEAAFPFNKEVLKEAYSVHRGLRRWTKWLRFFSWVALAGGVWLLAMERRFLEGGIVAGVAAFMEAVNAWLSGLLRNGPQEGARLARVAEVWANVNTAMRDAEAYNLDRKPLVFSVFGQLAEAARA